MSPQRHHVHFPWRVLCGFILLLSTVRPQDTTTDTTTTPVAAPTGSNTGTGAGPTISSGQYATKSGLGIWIDPDTPSDRQSYVSSRGRRWELVMSDEFNAPQRDFRPGKDHMWTSVEKPDGVNGALELYSHNMTSTECDADGNCYFFIKIERDHQVVRPYNMYLNPPRFVDVDFYYRSAMVQSWNKFCFQGGMLEARVQLPGVTSSDSGNPDLAKGPNGRTAAGGFYPTWPGIWMMGNLARAIFSASTNRMWPFSYNECNPDVFDTQNQRISACDSNPGYGMNPNQGRGAPEIDLLEGSGLLISSSLQIGPGMPWSFRPIAPDLNIDPTYCIYTAICKTPGANNVGVPTALYKKRGHPSWYQGLRYAANPFCQPNATQRQSYEEVRQSVRSGITENACTLSNCPGSRDPFSDLGTIDGQGSDHWGVNTNGTCFPLMNVYNGAYLCDPDNQNKLCAKPRPDNVTKTNAMKPFNYQMDAISANWPVHVAAYTEYVTYQMEWVTGVNGYVRWMLDGHPIFEVTADTFTNVPQDAAKSNPRKIMIEEPMYLIFNVALSQEWGSRPPNAGGPCKGKTPEEEKICEGFPLKMKIDYIRIYQDQGKDLDSDNYMQVGCDPKSHPTKQWISGHIDEYQDYDNLAVDVQGGAFCRTDEDCTVSSSKAMGLIRLVTGKCSNNRCECTYGNSWGGPRCTFALSEVKTATGTKVQGYGPPMGVSLVFGSVVTFLTIISVWISMRKEHAYSLAVMKATSEKKTSNLMSPGDAYDGGKPNYSQNFV